MLATWGTSGLKEHGSSLTEEVKILFFTLFLLFIFHDSRQFGFDAPWQQKPLHSGIPNRQRVRKPKIAKKTDLTLAWQESLRNLAKLTG